MSDFAAGVCPNNEAEARDTLRRYKICLWESGRRRTAQYGERVVRFVDEYRARRNR